MLRRQREVRRRVQQLVDAGIFTLAFWLAHSARSHLQFLFFWERPEIEPFEAYAWLILVILLAVPLLVVQGFYDRPLLASRRQTLWRLFWACSWTTIIVILVSFLVREQPARGVIVLFGVISFFLVLIKEEMLRRWVESKFGGDRLKKRLLLAGVSVDFRNMIGHQHAVISNFFIGANGTDEIYVPIVRKRFFEIQEAAFNVPEMHVEDLSP